MAQASIRNSGKMADNGSGAAAPSIDPGPPSSAPATTTTADRAAKPIAGATPQTKAPEDDRESAIDAQSAIAADDDAGQTAVDKDDEGLGSDASSRASTSISSSVRDYAFENNRRYHKFQEGRYHFPNDEPEQEREDMKHAMIINLMSSRLHLAPLENPQAVLDIGTGTGIWAIDSACLKFSASRSLI